MKINKYFSIKKNLIYLMIFLSIFICKVDVFANPKDNSDKIPIFCVDTDEKKIALTFDLNWCEEDYLYPILDVLDKYNVKSTFFVMGKWINFPEGNKVKFLEVVKRGHEIGNHSYQHPNFLQINRKQIEKEIVNTEKIIYDITGKRSDYFRFPGGGFTGEGVKIVNENNLKAIQWSKDSLDWKNTSADFEYNRVMKNIQAGDIILFHNNGKYTATNLQRIIPKLQAEGYKFVTIGELVYKNDFFVNENGKQFKIN